MNNPRRIQRHLVKALAAGALLAAAALPMAIATAAGAATPATITSVVFSPSGADNIGTGASGTATINGTGFAADGGNVTVTSNAPGLTFTETGESTTAVSTTFASTAATVPGTYSVTVVDDNGTATLAGSIVVDAAPGVTSLSAPGLVDSVPAPTPTQETITGAGFVTGATVTFTSTVNGTTLAAADTAAHANGGTPAGTAVTGDQGKTTGGGTVAAPTTTLSTYVSPTNSVTGSSATPGTYTVTVTNPDGGTFTSTALLTITGIVINNVSPSAVTTPAINTVIDVPVTISGGGFQAGPAVTLTGCTGVTVAAGPVATSSTAITATFVITTGGTALAAEQCSVDVANPAVSAGGNGASFALANAFGVGMASAVAPTVTATSATTPIAPGSATSIVTFTGTGFSSYSTAAAYVGTSATVASGISLSSANNNAGTSASFNLTVAPTGTTAGPDSVVISNGSAHSAAFPAAFSVAGPAITSMTPATVAVGAAIGTTVVLTGTGFTNTTTGSVTDGAGGALQGVVSYVSPTTLNLVITHSPDAADAVAATAPTVSLSQEVSGSVSVASAPFTISVSPAPTISTPAITYPGTTTDVGVGATAQTVTFHGTGFLAGATIGKFVNGNGVADPDVTATVTGVNTSGTEITATIAIATGDTNIADGYTITNTNGGSASSAASLSNALVIGAGPTITSVTPATGASGATTSFAVAGTGFEAGATASLSPANGTCGAVTVSASTTLAATCTLGKPSSVATDLVITNPDGGSATSTTAVLPAQSTTTAPTFHVSGVHGAAVAGKTVTITISGTGFYGQPKITSTAAGSKFGVVKDNGRVLTVHATIKAGTKAGEHTLTVRLANGKSGKAGFNIKA